MDPDCSNVVTKAWREGTTVIESLGKLPDHMRRWNKEHFGNIFYKKRRLRSQLLSVQKGLARRFDHRLAELENSITEEYNLILRQEEAFWYQKSRIKWLQMGDRNTRFFHLSTICRRRRNKIDALIIDGEWQRDSDILKTHVKNFYEKLFTEGESSSHLLAESPFQRCLDEHAIFSLEGEISDSDILKVVRSMCPHKAPGPDGCQAFFYQKFWNVVGESVVKFVQDCFRNCEIPDNVGLSYITLIPKVQNPSSITEFRPIALCNVLIKIITKAIVFRFKPYMNSIVSPNQSSFIPGRSTHDNIIVLQELVHSLNRSKSPVGGMLIKIDLEKAYDKVSWNFLEQTLTFFKVPVRLIKLIMAAVKSVRPSILWNGEPLEHIQPSCGLRQGDPLSPYLFVLCMERLTYLIEEEVEKNHWKSLALCRNGPKFSHMLFADDLILASKPTFECALAVKKVMEKFCDSSGLRVNFAKSRVFFSPKTNREIQEDIALVLGIERTEDIGRYLGVNITAGRQNRFFFNDLLEKVQRKLSAWKAKSLTMAGRLTLIKSVTSSIPIYSMHTNWLPSHVCVKLDKINRDFLWGDDVNRKKVHLVGWNKVLRKKEEGGLGIRDSRKTNIAMMAKLGWKIFKKEDSVWSKTFQNKYLKGRGLLDHNPSPQDSRLWKGITRSFQIVKNNIKWKVGDGRQISLWYDKWLDEGIIGEDLGVEVLEEEKHLTLADVRDEKGKWNLGACQTLLPEYIKKRILELPLSFNRGAQDLQIWGASPNGMYSCKTAYDSIIRTQLPSLNGERDWNWIWKLSSPMKLKTFVWLGWHNKLLTNALRFDRNFAANDICVRCNCEREDVLHMLFRCPKAMRIWEFIIMATEFTAFLNQDTDVWLRENCKNNFRNIIAPECPWNTIFIAAIWCIWKARNKKVFRNEEEHPRHTVQQIKTLATDINSAFTVKSKGNGKLREIIGWKKPQAGWWKLNSDGSVLSNVKKAAAGGILRDYRGRWIAGYSMHLGEKTITEAELIGLREGLRVAWDMRPPRIEIELDSKCVLDLIKSTNVDLHYLGHIIEDCRAFLRKPWEITIKHILREGNGCADLLAKEGHNIDCCMVTWDSPPTESLLNIITEESS